MLGGGGAVILLSVMPRPSMIACGRQRARPAAGWFAAAGTPAWMLGTAGWRDGGQAGRRAGRQAGRRAATTSPGRCLASRRPAHQQHAAKHGRSEGRPQARSDLQEATGGSASDDGVEGVLLQRGVRRGGGGELPGPCGCRRLDWRACITAPPLPQAPPGARCRRVALRRDHTTGLPPRLGARTFFLIAWQVQSNTENIRPQFAKFPPIRGASRRIVCSGNTCGRADQGAHACGRGGGAHTRPVRCPRRAPPTSMVPFSL